MARRLGRLGSEREDQDALDGLPSEELLSMLKGRVPGAFDTLVGRLYPALVRVIHRRIGCSDLEAEDLLQESLLEAAHSVGEIRATSTGGVFSWIVRIACRRSASLRRRQAERHRPRRASPYPWALLSLCDSGHLGLAQAAPREKEGACGEVWLEELGALEAEGRMAWILHAGFGLPWASLAAVLRRPSPAAARELHRRTVQRLIRAGRS